MATLRAATRRPHHLARPRARRGIPLLALLLVAWPLAVQAQQARVHRGGVVTLGGPYRAAVDGLRDGLRELGLEEGKGLTFDVRDVQGDLALAESTARTLEKEKVDLPHAVPTAVALVVKRAAERVPIV